MHCRRTEHAQQCGQEALRRNGSLNHSKGSHSWTISISPSTDGGLSNCPFESASATLRTSIHVEPRAISVGHRPHVTHAIRVNGRVHTWPCSRRATIRFDAHRQRKLAMFVCACHGRHVTREVVLQARRCARVQGLELKIDARVICAWCMVGMEPLVDRYVNESGDTSLRIVSVLATTMHSFGRSTTEAVTAAPLSVSWTGNYTAVR